MDFRNTVIVMTSNAGVKNITAQELVGALPIRMPTAPRMGEKSFEAVKDAVMAELKRTFRPEFLNRIDETIIFHPLNAQNIAEIARKLLAVTAKRVDGLGISMEVDDAAVELVAKEGFDPVYGALSPAQGHTEQCGGCRGRGIAPERDQGGRSYLCHCPGRQDRHRPQSRRYRRVQQRCPGGEQQRLSTKQYQQRQPPFGAAGNVRFPAVFSYSPALPHPERHKKCGGWL